MGARHAVRVGPRVGVEQVVADGSLVRVLGPWWVQGGVRVCA